MSKLMSALKKAIRSQAPRIWLITKGLVIKATLVEGELSGKGLRFRCLLIGSSVFNDDFVARIYGEVPKVIQKRRVPFFMLKFVISMISDKFDLCVASLPLSHNFLEAISSFEGQVYVTQVIDTSGSWDGVRNNLARSRRTLINNFESKFGLEMRISVDEQDLAAFYHDMYLPYTRERFGRLAVIHSLPHMRSLLHDSGVLVIIESSGIPVAAALCQHKNKKLIFNCAGVPASAPSMPKCGPLAAIFYYMLKHAVDNGLEQLDVQQSRPFLTDGVFDSKGRWGAVARPCGDFDNTRVSYVLGSASSRGALAHLFEQCPVVVRRNSRLQVVVGCTEALEPTTEEVRKSLREYHLAGLDSAVVFTSKGHADCALH